MKKKVFVVLCAVLIVFSSVLVPCVVYAAVSGTDAIEFVEAPVEEIAEAMADVTALAAAGGSSGGLTYGVILSLADDALQLKNDTYLLVDTNSYNADTGDYDIAYGIAVDTDGNRGLARYGGGGGAGKSRFVTSAEDIEFTGATFAEICAQLQEQYAPGNADGYLSWKEGDGVASYWRCYTYAFPIFEDGSWISSSNTSNGVYCVPYYYDGTKYYYNDIQYYFTGTTVDGKPYIQLTTTSLLDGSTYTYNVADVTTYRYQLFEFISGGTYSYVLGYKTYAELQNAASSSYGWRTTYNIGILPYNFYDVNYKSLGWTNNTFSNAVAFAKSAPTDSETRDYGVIWSDEPIEIGFCMDIDTTRIDPDATVTLAGDTVYDYTITNTNGDTTTINYYITNNYTIPENADDNTDEDNGNTSTSGDITVGGKVDVSGGIDVGGQVDININVNSGSSGTAEAASPSMPVEVDLIDYLEKTPEQAKPITQFFEVFFDFLPPELLALICLGVVVAILLRIWGR